MSDDTNVTRAFDQLWPVLREMTGVIAANPHLSAQEKFVLAALVSGHWLSVSAGAFEQAHEVKTDEDRAAIPERVMSVVSDLMNGRSSAIPPN